MPEPAAPGSALAGLLGGGASAPSPSPAPAAAPVEAPPDELSEGEDELELAFQEFESAEDPEVRMEALRLIIEQVTSGE